jgi:hypothetical protein
MEIEYAKGKLIHTPIVMRPVADDHWVRFRYGYSKDDKQQVMELVDDVKVRFVFERQTYVFEIDAGFVFDGASIPQMFWGAVGSPWDANILVAALVHDACYSAHPISSVGEFIHRSTADEILRTLCKYLGMGVFKREIVYRSVDLFGEQAWHKKTPYLPEIARKVVRFSIH